MAAYREHISVSGVLGAMYMLTAMFGLGFTWVQSILAGCLAGFAGMLPDLDAEGGRPVRELFAILGVAAPLVLVEQIVSWGGDGERALLMGLIVYLLVRYGGAALLGRVCVHRGMFHSLPALAIAAEIAFMIYRSDSLPVKLLMAGAVALGFFSHLLLDEVYSVDWTGATVKLKKSAGSALKLAGKNGAVNMITYALLASFSYNTWQQVEHLRLLYPRDILMAEEIESSAPMFIPDPPGALFTDERSPLKTVELTEDQPTGNKAPGVMRPTNLLPNRKPATPTSPGQPAPPPSAQTPTTEELGQQFDLFLESRPPAPIP